MKLRCRRGEQAIELAGPVEGAQVVITADVAPVNENLRNRAAAAAALDHLVAAPGFEHHVDLGVLGALLLEQPLRRAAVAAERLRVYEDARLRHATSPAADYRRASRRSRPSG